MIYLREAGGRYVGPFKSREDAERFIRLMELCGENWEDSEIVEEDCDHSTAGQPERVQ